MPTKSQTQSIRNHLLAALPGKEYERLLPSLESVSLPLMDVLCESGGAIEHVYFPNAGLIQDEKMISYTRGPVTVLDWRRLEATACGCYAALKAEDARHAYASGRA